MNRIDKYCIGFSCFFINFFTLSKTPLRLEENASTFYLKRKYVLPQTQVRFTSNASAFYLKHKYVLVETQGRFRKLPEEG